MHALKWLFSGIPPMTLKWLFFARKYSYTEFIGFESTTLEKTLMLIRKCKFKGKNLDIYQISALRNEVFKFFSELIVTKFKEKY